MNNVRRHRVHTFRDFCAVCWVSPVEPGSACSGERGERPDPRWPMDVAYDEMCAAERFEAEPSHHRLNEAAGQIGPDRVRELLDAGKTPREIWEATRTSWTEDESRSVHEGNGRGSSP